MTKIDCVIETQVNEVYIKSIVTQNFINTSKEPLELKIGLRKDPNILFNCFQAKIGDSIIINSKVISEEKAYIKYSDTIASGNAAIFVAEDKSKNNCLINMGNIPPNEKVLFISEYIYFIKRTNYYEFEIFRKLPIFINKESRKFPSKIKETIHITTKNKICSLFKQINVKELKILEEKYLNEEKTEYLFCYELDKLPKFYYNDINTSKIYFDTFYQEPKIFYQKSKKMDEDSYIIQYRYKDIKSDDINIPPGLFIFLIDQSGSMEGNRIDISKKALELFLQSLPAKSYFQLIGFGSKFIKYDETPKEYTKENIIQSQNIIKQLEANFGGTNIYYPLINIYNDNIYDNIKLKKKIFLLTDGRIKDPDKVLELIKTNNSKFNIISIGIGNNFDENLIKNAGFFGKGSSNYCRDMNELNSVVVREICNSNNSFVSDFEIKCSLDEENILKKTKIEEPIKNNDIINFTYIISRKNIDKINFEVSYNTDEKKNIKNNYEIIPIEFPEGEELIKISMKDNLKDLSGNEKMDKLIKYQILDESTSLFAEIELSNQITEEMKLKIIGTEENKILNYYYPHNSSNRSDSRCLSKLGSPIYCDPILLKKLNSKNRSNNFIFSGGIFEENDDEQAIKKEEKKEKIEQVRNQKLDEKEKIMEIVKTQDFIEGFWDINEKNKFIIEKYKKEYEGLKLKYKNEKIIMTILIIYYLNKECIELLEELIMIIKKAKAYILKEINCSYEDVVKNL